MRLIIFLSFLFLNSFHIFIAQDQIENSDFENWENTGSSDIEPLNWSSIKNSDNSFLSNSAPQVIYRSSNSHSGNYSIKLKNESIFGIVANGIATTGRIHAEINGSNSYVYTDISNNDYHHTFTNRPDSLTGWYMYQPQGNDVGEIKVLLHNGATQIPTSDHSNWIGLAQNSFTGNISQWTRFSCAFHYYNNSTPSYLLAVISAGDSTIAIDGSELYIDDLVLIYNPPVSTNNVTNNISNEIELWYSNSVLHFFLDSKEKHYLRIYDIYGRPIINKQFNSNKTSYNLKEIPKGIFIAEISNGRSRETIRIIR